MMDFIFKNATPNQITEVVIAIAPINTRAGGNPKYTSVNIPMGINKSSECQPRNSSNVLDVCF
jgi:hypothetical protein